MQHPLPDDQKKKNWHGGWQNAHLSPWRRCNLDGSVDEHPPSGSREESRTLNMQHPRTLGRNRHRRGPGENAHLAPWRRSKLNKRNRQKPPSGCRGEDLRAFTFMLLHPRALGRNPDRRAVEAYAYLLPWKRSNLHKKKKKKKKKKPRPQTSPEKQGRAGEDVEMADMPEFASVKQGEHPEKEQPVEARPRLNEKLSTPEWGFDWLDKTNINSLVFKTGSLAL